MCWGVQEVRGRITWTIPRKSWRNKYVERRKGKTLWLHNLLVHSLHTQYKLHVEFLSDKNRGVYSFSWLRAVLSLSFFFLFCCQRKEGVYRYVSITIGFPLFFPPRLVCTVWLQKCQELRQASAPLLWVDLSLAIGTKDQSKRAKKNYIFFKFFFKIFYLQNYAFLRQPSPPLLPCSWQPTLCGWVRWSAVTRWSTCSGWTRVGDWLR